MNRLHLVEIHDLPACPPVIRRGMTDYLLGISRLAKLHSFMAPYVQRVLDASDAVLFCTTTTVRVLLLLDGPNLFASFVWMGATGGQTSTTHPWGINIQGGYFVTDDIEVFGRYGLMNYDLDNAATDTGKYNGLTAGANYFFADNVKFTVEWGMNLKSFGANGPANINSAGFRTDVNGEKDQWALRAQMQLLF